MLKIHSFYHLQEYILLAKSFFKNDCFFLSINLRKFRFMDFLKSIIILKVPILAYSLMITNISIIQKYKSIKV